MSRLTILLPCVLMLTPHARAERVDNVLAQMVPNDTTSLIGMRMEQLKSTPLFQKLIAQRKLPQIEQFAAATGFDPRRDVRDLMLASNGKESVLLARGSFHLNGLAQAKKSNYHGYLIYAKDSPLGNGGGFCLLDATLAVAGPLPALKSALDQYKSGRRDNAAALLGRARAIAANYQIWGVTAGISNYFGESLAGGPGAPDMGKMLRSLRDTVFEVDLRDGVKGFAEGYCGSAQDAKSLADAARGMVGMARLKTPEKEPDLLRVWDGIKVQQTDRKITLTVDIGQDLIDQILRLIHAV